MVKKNGGRRGSGMLLLVGTLMLSLLHTVSSSSGFDASRRRRVQSMGSANTRRREKKDETPEPTPLPTRAPTLAPTKFPTTTPTATPTQKGMGSDKDNQREPTSPPPTPFPSPSQTIKWWTEKPVLTLWPTSNPTNPWVQLTKLTNPPTEEIETEDPTPSPTTATPTETPTLTPTTLAPVTRAPATRTPSSVPTAIPSSAPVSGAPVTAAPVTAMPTIAASTAPSVVRSAVPTTPPTKVPTAAPIRVSVPVAALPAASPTDAPVAAPAAGTAVVSSNNATASTSTTNTVTLSEFSILLVSEGTTVVNLGQLERTLESYMLSNLKVNGLEAVSLTLLEGDSKEGPTSISTSVRFAGATTFKTTTALPLQEDVRAEQGYVLEDLVRLQSAMDQNADLAGVSVADISFERINTQSEAGQQDVQNNNGSPSSGGASSASKDQTGVLLGVFSASVVAIAAALLIVRHRRMSGGKHQPKLVNQKEDTQSPASITAEEANPYEESVVDVKPGCKSLCSADISLGADDDGDLSTYMMTASPKTYNPINHDIVSGGSNSKSTNPFDSITAALEVPSSPKPPTAEISIRQDYEDDYDDNYLTNDETSVTL